MLKWGTFLLELFIVGLIVLIFYKFLWKYFSKGAITAIFLLSFCALFVSFSIVSNSIVPKRTVTITAQGKNSDSKETSIYLVDILLDGSPQGVPEPVSGNWTWYAGRYCWFEADDNRLQEKITESVTIELNIANKTELLFLGNQWKGIVRLQVDNVETTFDTYVDSGDGVQIGVILPAPNFKQIVQAFLFPALEMGVVFSLLCILLTVIVIVGEKIGVKLPFLQTGLGPFQRLLQYQFLFEELVKRDFKKKYKRTVLGMAWSILSPLLTLLVMRLVFTQFFGRNTPHYTTYLFCGNLVFSYFNESTSQGMTSLMGNSSIFTKVNVPKYLFLFSKNVQTLINFGLTLCVFFIFCVLDNITFTWKIICLIYPVCCLVLFNIGVGLILSALFVFFCDIQYLWSVFIQLLMYMSAIFYTIDNYSPMAQNLFLLNPVYLFIRYFRKIVIESTIPTIYFHLLMLADVAIVLTIGCWIYKKFNTRFLYYV